LTIYGLMQETPLLISSLLDYAASYHGKREIVTRTVEGPIHRYTYADARARAAQAANALVKLGVAPGDRIATLAWNTHRHFELFYAVSGLGAVLHTVNPRLFEEQIRYIVNHAEDRVIFLDLNFVELAEKLVDSFPTVEHYVILTDRNHMPETSLPNALCYEDLIADESTTFEWPEFDENTASSLCYTSGTTGDPKGVLYSHRSTVIHALGAAQKGALDLGCADAILPIAPMYHANAWAMPYIAPMVGAKLVLPGPKMDAPSILELINGEKVTFACAVPTVWTMVLEHLQATGGRIDSLKRTTIGGSAVPQSMMDIFREQYGVTVLHLWGMTETSPMGTVATQTPDVTALPQDAKYNQLAKQGRVQYGLDIKIIDKTGTLAPRDGETSGDLWIKGPWAARCYYKRENESPLDADGWFPTGDVATWDAYGYMKITDRTKDVIKSGGEWISSIELENAAAGHPQVRQAAVIGVYHPKWEERPLLLVVPSKVAAPTKQEILDFLSAKFAKWQLPEDVLFLDELPLTATGKIMKTALREMYKDFSFSDDGS
jgi:3-(methylthio)propionyl---CoA ligase